MRELLLGVVAAVFATFVWALNFVAPFVVGDYTILDLALVRFGVSGLVGGAVLLAASGGRPRVRASDWMQACWLAFCGYSGYFLAVTAAAVFAGPVIAAAFLGVVPVVVAIAGNYRQRSLPWRSLIAPLAAILAGLLCVNLELFGLSLQGEGRTVLLGVGLAATAVAFWTWFALANQSFLARRPDLGSSTWTAMLLVAGGAQMLVVAPLAASAGVLGLATEGASWHAASSVYIWGVVLALLSSVAGAWAWTVASRLLPVALAAQLVVLETVFGAVFGLVALSVRPGLVETVGLVLLVFGAVGAIRAFYARTAAAVQPGLNGGAICEAAAGK